VEFVVRAKLKWLRPALLLLLLGGLATQAHANVAVLLEEPYSYDGALAGTGHTAVYLTRVCAETPVMLRRCKPGEHGAVVSRYTRIGGYDWIAIPLVPYLYAVEQPEDIPLYADAKLVAFLRDQYRRTHLEDIAPDAPGRETPKGDWLQLAGSAYDRASYGFEIETTPAQDDALIAWLNSRPNHASYKVVSRNCADFVRDILNFYYPKSVSHGSIPDFLISTPKHAARSLVKYSQHHPDLEFTHFVVPQVPGAVKRSKPVRGVLESLVRAKKYVAALIAFHPVVVGGVEATYFLTDRFNPAKNTLVFNLTGPLEAPPTKKERRAYQKDLETVAARNQESEASSDGISWRKFEEKAQPTFDADGQAALEASVGPDTEVVGVTRRDLLDGDAPANLERGLMVSRLRQALARSRAPRISDIELQKDWQLLEKIDRDDQEDQDANARLTESSE